jgi:leucyl/phenylalanyl-tRNA--protein transferase
VSRGRVAWLAAGDPPGAFPPVEQALHEPDGLLAAGGDLGVERLLAAYRRGIFPWYEEGQPLLWWSPDPRCVFRPGDYRLSRRLRREMRRSAAELRFNSAFDEVVEACAGPRRHQRGTWITKDMMRAYGALHRAGWAHSIEVWRDGALAGGLYGIVIGRAFFGESMFSGESNASKIALLLLNRMLDKGTIGIVDCQVQSAHLQSLGAAVIPRTTFTVLLDELCEPQQPFADWPSTPVAVPELLSDGHDD